MLIVDDDYISLFKKICGKFSSDKIDDKKYNKVEINEKNDVPTLEIQQKIDAISKMVEEDVKTEEIVSIIGSIADDNQALEYIRIHFPELYIKIKGLLAKIMKMKLKATELYNKKLTLTIIQVI